MSMISNQVENLRRIAEFEDEDGSKVYVQIMREAADTIEELAAKLHAANMERSAAYYNGGWIPCEDRLPINDGKYIVCNNGFVIPAKYFTYSPGKHAWFGEFDELHEVTAWMPLPNPYKEGNNED